LAERILSFNPSASLLAAEIFSCISAVDIALSPLGLKAVRRCCGIGEGLARSWSLRKVSLVLRKCYKRKLSKHDSVDESVRPPSSAMVITDVQLSGESYAWVRITSLFDP
jgi:hypothetical protein